MVAVTQYIPSPASDFTSPFYNCCPILFYINLRPKRTEGCTAKTSGPGYTLSFVTENMLLNHETCVYLLPVGHCQWSKVT